MTPLTQAYHTIANDFARGQRRFEHDRYPHISRTDFRQTLHKLKLKIDGRLTLTKKPYYHISPLVYEIEI